MKTHDQTPSDIFNSEDSNHTANPQFDQILEARLSRRNILRGSIGDKKDESEPEPEA